MISSCTADP